MTTLIKKTGWCIVLVLCLSACKEEGREPSQQVRTVVSDAGASDVPSSPERMGEQEASEMAALQEEKEKDFETTLADVAASIERGEIRQKVDALGSNALVNEAVRSSQNRLNTGHNPSLVIRERSLLDPVPERAVVFEPYHNLSLFDYFDDLCQLAIYEEMPIGTFGISFPPQQGYDHTALNYPVVRVLYLPSERTEVWNPRYVPIGKLAGYGKVKAIQEASMKGPQQLQAMLLAIDVQNASLNAVKETLEVTQCNNGFFTKRALYEAILTTSDRPGQKQEVAWLKDFVGVQQDWKSAIHKLEDHIRKATNDLYNEEYYREVDAMTNYAGELRNALHMQDSETVENVLTNIIVQQSTQLRSLDVQDMIVEMFSSVDDEWLSNRAKALGTYLKPYVQEPSVRHPLPEGTVEKLTARLAIKAVPNDKVAQWRGQVEAYRNELSELEGQYAKLLGLRNSYNSHLSVEEKSWLTIHLNVMLAVKDGIRNTLADMERILQKSELTYADFAIAVHELHGVAYFTTFANYDEAVEGLRRYYLNLVREKEAEFLEKLK